MSRITIYYPISRIPHYLLFISDLAVNSKINLTLWTQILNRCIVDIHKFNLTFVINRHNVRNIFFQTNMAKIIILGKA